MYSPFEKIKVEIYGESHSEVIGVKISGIEKGFKIDLDKLQEFTDRRKSGKNAWSTPRKEADVAEFVSGVCDGVTTGETIEAVVRNANVRSSDYNEIKYTPRPSHADYVCAVKDGTMECPSGGGRFSGRMTAPLVIAGGIAKQILARRGIRVLSYIRTIGGVTGENYLTTQVTEERISAIETPLKALTRADKMERAVMEAKENLDSVGGTVDIMIFGMPVGIGDNLFQGLEGRIASAVYGVPAVKGVEFGLGFGFADAKASEVNDLFTFSDGKVVTVTNNSGGINGGISNGMPITLSVAFRPTPSIARPQKTVNLRTGENVEITIKGRHDACIVPRGAVALEAAVALAVLDAII